MSASFLKLRTILQRSGYLQNYLTFGDGNQRLWDWERCSELLKGSNNLLWDTLLCGKTAKHAALEKLLPKGFLKECQNLGICARKGETISFNSISLVACYGTLFFMDRGFPSHAYFGDDSKMLMAMRPGLKEGRSLLLHSGTGVEGIGLCESPQVELSIEVGKSEKNVVAANLCLNSLNSEARVLIKDCGTAKDEYDLILARIPSFVELDGYKLPAAVSGGVTGRERFEAAIKTAGKHLSPQGSFFYVGLIYGGDDVAKTGKELQSFFKRHGLNTAATISTKLALEVGIPVMNQTLNYAHHASGKQPSELLAPLQKHFKDLGYTHALLIKGVAWRSQKSMPGSVLDLSSVYYGAWIT